MRRSGTVSFLFVLMHGVVLAQGDLQDPLKPAKEAKARVEQTEARVVKSLEAIEQLCQKYRPDDWQTEKLILDEFRVKLIPAMKQAAADLLEKKDDFDKAFKLYQSAVEKAPAAFNAAADQFERYADDEDDMLLKEQYLDMKTHAQKWAAEMGQRFRSLDATYKEVNEKIRFVRKSAVFLDRLEEFLEIYPNPDKGAEIQAYLNRLNTYIDHFRRTIEAFGNFSKSLGNPGYERPGRHEPPRKPRLSQSPTPDRTLAFATLVTKTPRAPARMVSADPLSAAGDECRVSATRQGWHADGRHFEVAFDSVAKLVEGNSVRLTRPNGQSFTGTVLAVRGNRAVLATKALLPRLNDRLALGEGLANASSLLVAER